MAVSVVAALALALVGGGVAAGATTGFSRAAKVGAPSNASPNPHGFLQGVSCTSPGNCTSVGEYEDHSGNQQAMAVTETGGRWARASEVAAPTNSFRDPNAYLQSVSCASAGNCTAVGYYTSSSRNQEAMVATEARGKWGRAAAPNLPAGADSKAPSAELRGVSCTSAGDCTAVGSYYNGAGSGEAMVVTQAGGKWARAATLSLPTNAGSGSSAIAVLFQVSCWSKGGCTAVGLYSDGSGDRLAMVATETGGTWARAVELDQLPSGASGGWAGLFAVWCTSAGNCTAGGSYLDRSDSSHAMVATEAGGTWARATELRLPAGANATYPNAELEAVSCASAGNCAGFGVYSNVASYSLDLVVTETAGKWGRAAVLSAPSGSAGENTIEGGSGDGVSCTRKGSCVAVGSYGTGSGADFAMAASGTA